MSGAVSGMLRRTIVRRADHIAGIADCWRTHVHRIGPKKDPRPSTLCHQDPGVHPPATASASLAQRRQEQFPTRIGPENFLLPISPVEKMVNGIGQLDARSAGHAALSISLRLQPSSQNCQDSRPDPDYLPATTQGPVGSEARWFRLKVYSLLRQNEQSRHQRQAGAFHRSAR
jgi:hypothetical protein